MSFTIYSLKTAVRCTSKSTDSKKKWKNEWKKYGNKILSAYLFLFYTFVHFTNLCHMYVIINLVLPTIIHQMVKIEKWATQKKINTK